MTDQPWLLQSRSEPVWRSPGSGRSDIHSFAWGVWPWMNWGLPLVAIITVGNGGWALLMLLMISPVLVPVLGLLGSLPRFLLRKSGITTTPAPITGLLFVHWWAWAAAMITPPGATDGSPIPAVMQGLSPRPISGGFLQAVMLGGSGIAVACWITVLILAIVLRARAALPAAPKRWTLVAWLAAVMLPVLFAAMIWLGGAVTAQQRDAAGETVAEAQTQAMSVQAQRALERHEQAQEQLSQVRGMIADDGWRISQRGIDRRTSFADAVDSYGFDLRFEHEPLAEGPVDVEAIEEELIGQGWTKDETGALVDPHGNVVEIYSNESSLQVSLVSPAWWGDSYELSDELGYGLDDAFARTYAYDEWPTP